MSQSALLVLATIVAVGDGTVTIDRGGRAGLEPGDRATVYYELVVNGEPRRIEVTTGRVLHVEERAAALAVPRGAQIRVGYLVEAQLPQDRLPPASEQQSEVTRLRQQLEDLEAKSRSDAAAHQRELDALRAEARVAQRRIAALEAELAATRDELAERREAATVVTADEEIDLPEVAAEPTPPGIALEPTGDAAAVVARPPPPSEPELALLPAGRYTVGVPSDTARFYNEQPAFSAQLGALRIDPDPVTVAQLQGESLSVDGSPTVPATSVSWLDASAFCRRRGGRLPSEQEWEVAMRTGVISGGLGLLEWTDSWYQPYPGNDRAEAEYGQRFRVLRGSGVAGEVDASRRRFLDPESRNAKVGFRCVVPP